MAGATPNVSWRLAGEEAGGCNCAWGCPCQFNALPTDGHCEGFGVCVVEKGHFGETRLDGVRFAGLYSWPGPIHEGNGTRLLIVDERASAEQRAAVEALETGEHGGAFFEIFAAMAPHNLPPLVAPIDLELDYEARTGRVRIEGVLEHVIEPIRNPVTGEEHRARIVLPGGFEFEEAEMADSVLLRVTAAPPLSFAYEHTYAQLNRFEWTSE